MIGGLVHLLCLLSLSGKHPAVESCIVFFSQVPKRPHSTGLESSSRTALSTWICCCFRVGQQNCHLVPASFPSEAAARVRIGHFPTNSTGIFKPVWTGKRGGGAPCCVRAQGEEQSLEAVERCVEENTEKFKYGFSDLNHSVEKAYHCIDNPWLPKPLMLTSKNPSLLTSMLWGHCRSVDLPLPFCEMPSVWVTVSRFSTQRKKRVKKDCNKKACRCKSQEWLHFRLKKGIKLCKIH